MQEVLKKLQDSNEKQSKQILNLNESVAKVYNNTSAIDKTLVKLVKEETKRNKQVEKSEKRKAADAKRKKADNPLLKAIRKSEVAQKKTNKSLGGFLDGLGGALGGIGDSLLGVIKAPAFGLALGAGLTGGLVAALAVPAVHENLGKAFVKAIDWLDQEGVEKISSILNQVIDNVSGKIIEIGTNVANTMSDIFYKKVLTPLGEWWSTVNVNFMGLKFGGAGVNPFPAAGSFQGQLQQQGQVATAVLNNNSSSPAQREKAEKIESIVKRQEQYNKNISEYRRHIEEDQKKIKELEETKALMEKSPIKKGSGREKRYNNILRLIKEREKSISDRESWIETNQQKAFNLKQEFEEIQKLQTGGPVRVPGTGSGDKVPAFLPSGSFVLNRTATNHFFQEGGAIPKVPVMLEPGEMVFPKATENLERMNSSVPRFNSPRKNNGGANEMMLDPQTQYLQNGGKVFLHWAGTPHNGYASPKYHATIMKDGTPKQTKDYNTFGGGHTSGFNSQGIGISLDAMGMFNNRWPDFGNFGPYAVKPEQYKGMAKLTAEILKGWGYGPEYVTKNNVMTHAEAANIGDNKGGYGPLSDPNTIPSGDYRWDLWGLYENSAPGSGGDEIRNMIRSAFNGVSSPSALTQVGNTTTITDYNMDGKVDIQDVNWWTDILKNKPSRGQVVKLGTTDEHKIYDGQGWADWDPASMAASITPLSTQTPSLTTTTPSTQTPGGPNAVQSMMGGLFGAAENIPFIGDFIKGFKRGFNRDLDPNSPAAALQSFIFGSGGKNNNTSNSSNPFNLFGGGQQNVVGVPEGPLKTLGPANIDDTEVGLFKKLVAAEAGGEDLLGQALVARSVLNRLSLIQSGNASIETFLAKDETLKGVIMGPDQYQPISDGRINNNFTELQLENAEKAIEIAKNVSDLRGRLEAAGKDPADITKLVNATGFRNGSAFNDESQNVNVTQHGNHYFNTAGNKVMGYQKGGYIGPNVMLEPGESVWTPEMMNQAVPRFNTGGAVNLRGRGTMNDWIDSSMNQSTQQQIIIINTPQPQGGGMISSDAGSGTPDIPAMSNGPTSPLAGLLMTQTYLLADRIG